MSENPKIAYTLVESPSSMDAVISDIRRFDSLAVDLEMENNYHHYGLHIALIQISTPEARNYIFDPLSEINAEVIGEIFADPSVEIVIHDVEFDKRACKQVYGWEMRNLFDTKIAAQFCGYRKFGLAHLLQELLGASTNKRYQRIDWLKRPIKSKALDYAAGETCRLHALRNILTRRLKELGHMEWTREEFQYHEKAPANENLPPHAKVKHSSKLRPRQRAILAPVTRFREKLAKQLDRPVHFVIPDKLLIQICQKPPRDSQAIRHIKGMHPAIYREENTEPFMKAIVEGQSGPVPKRNGNHRSFGRTSSARPLKAMQQWRAAFARPYGIEPYLMLPNDILKWASKHGDQPMAPVVSSQLRNWQRKLIFPPFIEKFSLHNMLKDMPDVTRTEQECNQA